MKKYFLLVSLILLLVSCIAIQEAQNVVEISQQHQRIAVVPIRANIERKLWMTQEKHAELNQLKSEETQHRICRYLEFYHRNGSFHAEIMPQDEVNSILHGAGYPNTTLTNNDLCSLLHVDAVIYGRIEVLEPIGEAAALLLTSPNSMVTPITNVINLDLYIYDAKNAKIIWDSQQVYRGQVGSSKENMQRQACRKAVRNMPYNLKKRRYKNAYRQLNGL
jgi:hypothetical protein